MSNTWEKVVNDYGLSLDSLELETPICTCNCSICDRLPLKFHSLSCGCRLCDACFKHVTTNSVSLNCQIHNCPTNLNEVKIIELKEEDVAQTQAYCKYRENGCNNVDIIENLSNHEERECCFCYVECLLKCGNRILLKDAAKHFTVDCTNRIINCVFCSEDIKFFNMENHLKICPVFTFQCPNCETVLNKHQMPEHKKDCEHKPDCHQFTEMKSTLDEAETQTEPKSVDGPGDGEQHVQGPVEETQDASVIETETIPKTLIFPNVKEIHVDDSFEDITDSAASETQTVPKSLYWPNNEVTETETKSSNYSNDKETPVSNTDKDSSDASVTETQTEPKSLICTIDEEVHEHETVEDVPDATEAQVPYFVQDIPDSSETDVHGTVEDISDASGAETETESKSSAIPKDRETTVCYADEDSSAESEAEPQLESVYFNCLEDKESEVYGTVEDSIKTTEIGTQTETTHYQENKETQVYESDEENTETAEAEAQTEYFSEDKESQTEDFKEDKRTQVYDNEEQTTDTEQRIERLEMEVKEMKKNLIVNNIYSKKLQKILRGSLKRRLEDIKHNVELSCQVEEIKEKVDKSCNQMKEEIWTLKTKIEKTICGWQHFRVGRPEQVQCLSV